MKHKLYSSDSIGLVNQVYGLNGKHFNVQT